MQRVNVSFDDKLLERVDQYADQNGFKRSELIAVALRDYMDAKEQASALKGAVSEWFEGLSGYVSGKITKEQMNAINNQTETRVKNITGK